MSLPFVVGTSNIIEQPLQLKVNQSDLLSQESKNEFSVPSAVCPIVKCLNGKN